tara:strand:+ start:101 stop:235 length:135 start_codon:yes stop_codon:yes gene_type:complete
MSYDDDWTEWEDQCRDCGSRFTNEGMHGGVECPHCDNDVEEEEE